MGSLDSTQNFEPDCPIAVPVAPPVVSRGRSPRFSSGVRTIRQACSFVHSPLSLKRIFSQASQSAQRIRLVEFYLYAPFAGHFSRPLEQQVGPTELLGYEQLGHLFICTSASISPTNRRPDLGYGSPDSFHRAPFFSVGCKPLVSFVGAQQAERYYQGQRPGHLYVSIYLRNGLLPKVAMRLIRFNSMRAIRIYIL